MDAFLRDYAETRRYMAGRPVRARLTPDGQAVLFLRSGPRSDVQALFETDLRTGRTRLVLDPQEVPGSGGPLSPEERAQLERQRVAARGFTRFELSSDGGRVLLPLSGEIVILERATGAARTLGAGRGALDPRFSPGGGAMLAYVRERDLYVQDLASDVERRLTVAGAADVTNGLAEFVAQEEMGRFEGYWWSPDGRLVAFEEADTRLVEKLAIVDLMHPERGADLPSYPRAGRANAEVRLGVVPAAGGPVRWSNWDRERYPYLCSVVWQKGGPLTAVVMNRGQSELLVLALDAADGTARTLLEERDPVWLNVAPGFPRWLEDGSGFLWMTERNGAPEIELRGPDGALRAPWVAAGHGLDALVGFDEMRRRLWFTGGADPTATELFVVDDGAPPRRVGTGDGGGAIEAALSKDGSRLLVTRSTCGEMPRTGVYAVEDEGTIVRLAELPSVAVEPPFVPTSAVAKIGDGEGFWASVTRPRQFTPGRKLPVIVDVYGGPAHQHVARTPRLLAQWMADQGYLVVAFDGRGTPRRGRAWERALRGDLGGVNLDDQVSALRALASEVPEIDLGRVGITGWSFGGYLAALAVMKRPDVFRAAVAGAPVVDWRDYDTFYTERYLGSPQEDRAAYDRSSLLSWAPSLDRPLLILHGTADDNVYFLHALKLSDALFRAGRPHELLPLAGLTHMVPDPIVVERQWERVMRHFREHL